MTAPHRVHADLSARRLGDRIEVLNWHRSEDKIALPIVVATFTLDEFIDTVCALSSGWEQLSPTNKTLRRLALATVFGGPDA